jgi:phage RecT family recombinase
MNTVTTVRDVMHEVKKPFEKLNTYAMDFSKECVFARQQLLKNSYTMSAAMSKPDALKGAILNVAAIGISLNPALAHAYLVPRAPKKGADAEVCLDVSFRGLVKLATDSGAISWCKAMLVYEGDTFVWHGVDRMPTHEMDPFDKDRMNPSDPWKKLRGGYCVAKLPDGTYMLDVMTVDELRKVAATSAAANGPWKTWPEEMCKKTLIKRASKSWPQGNDRHRFDEAVRILNEHEGLEHDPEVDDEDIARFVQLMATGEPMELLLFSKRVSEQTLTAAFNTAPHGQKTKFKERYRDIINKAEEQVDAWAMEIEELAESGDFQALENYDEFEGIEKELLDARIGIITHEQIRKMREEAA